MKELETGSRTSFSKEFGEGLPNIKSDECIIYSIRHTVEVNVLTQQPDSYSDLFKATANDFSDNYCYNSINNEVCYTDIFMWDQKKCELIFVASTLEESLDKKID